MTSCSPRDDVAARFSRATHYGQYDVLQRRTAERLKARSSFSGKLLDVGAGPGTAFTGHALTSVTAVDIALGMCQRLSEAFQATAVICADATALPFQEGVFDTLYSNLALQWCQPLQQAVSELARVLKVGGEAHLAVVCDGSLPELETLGFSVNHFLTATAVQQAFQPKDWQFLDLSLVTETVYFDDLHSLIYSIKGVGAGARQQPGQSMRLRGRQDWLSRVANADRLRQPLGLPLSYQILYLVAKKA